MMPAETFLIRTMSDTVETDIRRVHVIANEVLARYGMAPLTFEQLRQIADGPSICFSFRWYLPLNTRQNHSLPFNEAKRVEIRRHALEIAQKHRFDVDPPEFISGIENSLKETKSAGLRNILMTTGGRRYKHQAMERIGIGGYFEEIVDRDQTYYAKSRGSIIYIESKTKAHALVLLTGTATYIKAGNTCSWMQSGETFLEVVPIALATEHSYNDETTLRNARPSALVHSFEELMPSWRSSRPWDEISGSTGLPIFLSHEMSTGC
jgi:phosphoglycolate phosphatase-like HAD superfamily hydrolase